jgi:putative transposase
MDFVSDTLASGRMFRSLTIIDEYTRECPAIEVDTSLPGLRVIRVLDRLAEIRGLPEEIRVDRGPEFVCRALRSWCEHRQILLRYIEPGRPMQVIAEWRYDYNGERPHSSLQYRTPSEFAALLHQLIADNYNSAGDN